MSAPPKPAEVLKDIPPDFKIRRWWTAVPPPRYWADRYSAYVQGFDIWGSGSFLEIGERLNYEHATRLEQEAELKRMFDDAP